MRFFVTELRYACRTLLASPSSTFVAVLALTLGIGANSAVFSVVDSVLLRPLPYQSPERLVILWEANPSKGIREFYVAPPNYKDWIEQNRSFERMAAFRVRPAILTGGALPERLEAASVSAGMFRLLGAPMELGRGFAPGEDEPGRNRVVVLSHGLWQRRFGGDRSILGRKMILDGGSYEVVGVAARGFRLLDSEAELWTPYTLDARELQERGFHTLKVIARLKPGVTLEQARTEMRAIASRLERQYPDTNQGWTVDPVRMRDQLVGAIEPTLLTLLGAVCLVLLIACANAAILLLVRASGRQKEIAIRSALGATRWRIVRQMLCESLVLATAGGVLGLAAAYGGVVALVALKPASIPRLEEISIDGRVAAFTFALSLLTSILFGVGPALAATRPELNEILKSAGRTAKSAAQNRRTRGALVVAEIALSVALLVGAGLMLRSLARLQSIDPGFRADRVLTMEVALPETRYEGMAVARFYQRLLDRVRRLPAVRSAAVARNVPLSGGDPSLNFVIENRPALSSAEQPRAKYRAVSAGYFESMRVPLLAGRAFEESDAENSPGVVIINDAMARRFWPGENPIGRRMKAGFDDAPWCTIVGVVANIKHAGLDAETQPEMYYPYLQVPPALMNFVEGSMTIVVHTAGDPAQIAAAVRREVSALDPDQPVFHVRRMQEILDGSVAQPRFRAVLLAAFAAVALALGVTGLYGVISYSVGQRANEMGIRAAVGASRADLMRLVLGEAARLAIAGALLGVALAALLGRSIAKLLFGVKPADPATMIAVPVLLLIVAMIAAYVPAWRAARANPVSALR
jgi:putative ABC transport system permease protein